MWGALGRTATKPRRLSRAITSRRVISGFLLFAGLQSARKGGASTPPRFFLCLFRFAELNAGGGTIDAHGDESVDGIGAAHGRVFLDELANDADRTLALEAANLDRGGVDGQRANHVVVNAVAAQTV